MNLKLIYLEKLPNTVYKFESATSEYVRSELVLTVYVLPVILGIFLSDSSLSVLADSD